jgi:hypothetical protein
MKNAVNRKGDVIFKGLPRPRPAGVHLKPGHKAAIGMAALAAFGGGAQKYEQYKQVARDRAFSGKMADGYNRVMTQRMGRPDWYYGSSDVGMPST